MLRLVAALEKDSFETLTVSLTLVIILSISTIVISSFEIILFDNNGSTALQKYFIVPSVFLF